MEIRALSKTFGQNRLFEDLSFTVSGGLVLMAPSGWGKTTLLRIIMGLETPDAGAVLGAGRVGAVFQEDRLIPHMNALQNVALVCGKAVGSREIESELEAVGLSPETLALPAARLSGGQKRRVALVRAMLSPCQSLVLDEPFTGMDEAAMRASAALICRRREERPVLLATHDQAAVRALGWPVLRFHA